MRDPEDTEWGVDSGCSYFTPAVEVVILLLACTESRSSPDKAHQGFTLSQRGKWVLVCFVLVFLSENSPRCVSSPASAGGWEACPQWLTADSLCVKSYRRWTPGLESEITGQAGVRGQAGQGWAEPLGAAQIDKCPGARLHLYVRPLRALSSTCKSASRGGSGLRSADRTLNSSHLVSQVAAGVGTPGQALSVASGPGGHGLRAPHQACWGLFLTGHHVLPSQT